MKSLAIQFSGSHRRTIHGVLDLPSRPRAFAVLIPGFTASGALKCLVQLSRRLANLEIGVLRLDLSGTGRSEGDPANVIFSDYILDVVAAVENLTQRFRAPTILIGHSLGGCVARAASRQCPSLRSIVSLATPLHPSDLIDLLFSPAQQTSISTQKVVNLTIFGQNWPVSRDFLDDLRRQPQALPTLPHLLIHGVRDTVVPAIHARQTAEILGDSASTFLLPQSDHLFSVESEALQIAQLIKLWGEPFCDLAPDTPPSGETGEVVAQWSGQPWRTTINVQNRLLVADESTLLDGQDDGVRPIELLQAAIASSTAMTLGRLCRHQGLSVEKLIVKLKFLGVNSEGKGLFLRKIECLGDDLQSLAPLLTEEDVLTQWSQHGIVLRDECFIKLPSLK